jgi:tripartite-type tricarboxylate transporter receptor subunit TctC
MCGLMVNLGLIQYLNGVLVTLKINLPDKRTPQDRIDALSKGMVKAMKHDTFANYLRGASLDPATSPAGTEVWDKQLKENYAKAAEALKGLGLTN